MVLDLCVPRLTPRTLVSPYGKRRDSAETKEEVEMSKRERSESDGRVLIRERGWSATMMRVRSVDTGGS